MAPGGCRGSTRITRCNALGKSIVCIGLIEVGYRIWHDIVTLPHAACRPWPPMAECRTSHPAGRAGSPQDGAGTPPSPNCGATPLQSVGRSEEHTSELQSLMRISYAVFFLQKKKN